MAFEGEALACIRRYFPDLRGRRVCVVGSGDNYAAFALAGCGADVTSVDISDRQLEIAKERARSLELRIEFIRADATDLGALPQGGYDLVVSTNGFLVWISQLPELFTAVSGVLRQHGLYVFYDVHPFLRPWADQMHPLEMAKPYGNMGPFMNDDGPRSYEFHWTLGDIVNAQAEAGFHLKAMHETSSMNPRLWQDYSYEPNSEHPVLDWRRNPRAGLPAWLTVAIQKP